MAGRTAQPDPSAMPELPPLGDGVVVSGPGPFSFTGELIVEGAMTLRNLTLHLTGPARVRAGASLTLEGVHLVVADPPGTPNGTSRLVCDGPAHLTITDSSLEPVGAAHPIWWWQGTVEIRRFRTHNAELHLGRAEAVLEDTDYFELDISEGSSVQARRVSLVFLSTRTAQEEDITVSDIPARRPFTTQVALGHGSRANLEDVTLEIFLIYLYGVSHARLARIERAQIAFVLQDGAGTYRLPRGRLGTLDAPYLVPAPGDDVTGGPGVTLVDVGVDTWDAYLSGGPGSRYSFVDSVVDEMTLSGQVHAEVDRSALYADWLALRDEAELWVRDSTVGALSLVGERTDLATSQVKVDGSAQAHFQRVRFDCGILARGSSRVTVEDSLVPPTYATATDHAHLTGLVHI